MFYKTLQNLIGRLIIQKNWIGSAITAIGGLIGTSSSNSALDYNARVNRDMQYNLANTGYQRATWDMRKAGLNPILSTRFGPAKASGGVQPSLHDLGASFTSGINSGAMAEKAATEIEKLEQETIAIGEQIGLTRANIEKALEDARYISERTEGQENINEVSGVVANLLRGFGAEEKTSKIGEFLDKVLENIYYTIEDGARKAVEAKKQIEILINRDSSSYKPRGQMRR
jgi:hypothetical protein